MSQDAVHRLADLATMGRRFTGERKARLGDVQRGGRLRLDALTRYAQDVSDDDTTSAGLAAEPGWVVRSTVVDEMRPAVLGETLTFVTFCAALGSRWAERRLTVTGSHGARYEVGTLWVCIDHDSGKPVILTRQFVELYGEAAAGRTVKARLTNPKPPTSPATDVTLETWPLRVADYDVYDHVNNAAYWAVIEQFVPPTFEGGNFKPRRIRMEYAKGIGPRSAATVARTETEHGALLWWLDDEPGKAALASAAILQIPADLY